MPAYKNATIGRVQNGAMATVPFAEGETVEMLLAKARITLAEGEEVNDTFGNPIVLASAAQGDKIYYIVRNMKNGKY